MLIKLPSDIQDTEQIVDLLEDLQSNRLKSQLSNAFFRANPRFSQEPQALEMIINYLQTILENPLELKVTFAQDPDEVLILELTEWVRDNLGHNILLRTDVDPMLIGGVVIRSPQRIYDLSWNKKLGEQRDLLEKMVSHAN